MKMTRSRHLSDVQMQVVKFKIEGRPVYIRPKNKQMECIFFIFYTIFNFQLIKDRMRKGV